MRILGIESTCDETAAAVVKNGKEILSNVIATQHEIHSPYGGVFPELASRQHAEVCLPVIDRAIQQSQSAWKEIDLIAVASSPGLLGSLMVGVQAAKTLSYIFDIPLLGINHVEAHLWAALMATSSFPSFPLLGVVLSGGHTHILKMKTVSEYRLVGKTRDDAIGEAFDKVARILDLPYPGGPEIEKLARKGNPNAYSLKVGQIRGSPFDFSLSGIKTGVLYAAKGQDGVVTDTATLSFQARADLAASFQAAVFSDVIEKVRLAAKKKKCKTVLFGGGVACNQTLRAEFAKNCPNLHLIWPENALCRDNGAMIAGLAFHKYDPANCDDPFYLEPSSTFRID